MTATIYGAVYVVLLRHVKAQESPSDIADFSFFPLAKWRFFEEV